MCSLKCRSTEGQAQYFISTEVDRNTPWRQVSSPTLSSSIVSTPTAAFVNTIHSKWS